MIILKPIEMSWIKGQVDDPKDLCAHGKVQFVIDGKSLMSAEEAWTVSAAALYLLRTLDQNHTKESPLFEQLFPCCGHTMYDDGSENILIIGCPNGIDFQIVHNNGTVEITAKDNQLFAISKHDWCKAVLNFSTIVQKFYTASSPKQPFDEDAKKGFTKFTNEWQRRHKAAICV